jgi:hypothetical protein
MYLMLLLVLNTELSWHLIRAELHRMVVVGAVAAVERYDRMAQSPLSQLSPPMPSYPHHLPNLNNTIRSEPNNATHSNHNKQQQYLCKITQYLIPTEALNTSLLHPIKTINCLFEELRNCLYFGSSLGT